MEFYFPRMRILGTHNCGKERHDVFKLQFNLRCALFRRDYVDTVVSSFAHQINQNIMVRLGLYLLKALPWNTSVLHTNKVNFLSSDNLLRHELFHYFLSCDVKQDTTTTVAHIKCIT